MENLFFILATTYFLSRAPWKFGFKKYSIGHTGCTLLLPQNSGKFSTSFTNAKDMMHFKELTRGEVTYGSVVIQLLEPLDVMAEAEKKLALFMNTLQASYDVECNTGLSLGFTQKQNPLARGIVDYWQDSDGVDFKVKGWTNGRFIAVLYIRNISEVPVAKQEMYLDSLQFA